MDKELAAEEQRPITCGGCSEVCISEYCKRIEMLPESGSFQNQLDNVLEILDSLEKTNNVLEDRVKILENPVAAKLSSEQY